MNTYNAIGNVVADAEYKVFASGNGAAKFRLAVSAGYGDKKKTIFWDCTIFGERGEKMAPLLTKGKKIGVTAEVEPEEWEKDGVKHSNKSLIVRDFDFCERKTDGEAAPSAPASRPAARPAAAAPVRKPAPAAPKADDGDLPF